MTSRQFNGLYRPLVKAAWLRHCEATDTAPNNKTAYDVWYRQTLHDFTQGRIHTTKGISDKMQQHLIDQFKGATTPPASIPIYGWSDGQIARFHDLARSAWQAAVIDGTCLQFIPWTEAVLKRHKRAIFEGAWFMPNKKLSFDTIMADLAITANDSYWIKRTAEQGEIRLRYQLRRYLVDLDYLTKTTHTWEYVRGIYKQAQILPEKVEDCPADILWKVLAMLDTHIRRLCKDFNIRPMDLPTRSTTCRDLSTLIPEDAKHLYVGHELEHIPDAVHVARQEAHQEALPF